jgi:hypothetical protein
MLLGAFRPPKLARSGAAMSFPGTENQELAGSLVCRRREKKLNLIRTINPEFKDLAQTWGWKMIKVHEKMYP